jgi:hypothetical protein
MSSRTRFVSTVFAALSFAFLMACGSSTNSPQPPPSGAFSNTNLNGTYTFSISGQDADANGQPSFFFMAGSFTACGCTAGSISGGTVSLSDDTGVGSALSVNTSSGYSVSQDGRGKINLSIATSSGNFPVELDFALTSGSHGLVSRFDTGGTGSGTLDLQSSAVTLSTTTPYAFTLSGTDGGGNFLTTVGDFTLGSSGAIATGIQDVNDNTSPSTALTLSGSVTVGSGTAPGLATLASSFATLTFDVYSVDATHLKLIENDGQAFLVGDVFTQTSATIPQGPLVFEVAGPDPGGLPFAAAGIVSSDGSSTLSSGAEDVNDDGTVDGNSNPLAPEGFSGTFGQVPSSSGRFQLTLSGFLGGTSFAAYPSSGGILLLEVDTGLNRTVTSGVAMPQTAATGLSASQGYAMNMTGADIVDGTEIDEIAEFTASSSGLSGLIDANDFGVANPSTNNLNGTYTPGSNGTGEATFTGGPLGGVLYYGASSSSLFALSIDAGSDVEIGTIEGQTTPSSAAADVAKRQLSIAKAVAKAQKKKHTKTN